MTRKILFKGKHLETDKWVQGYLVIMWNEAHIIDVNNENLAYHVDSNTVCQYTGLKDKKGVSFFKKRLLFYSNHALTYSPIDGISVFMSLSEVLTHK